MVTLLMKCFIFSIRGHAGSTRIFYGRLPRHASITCYRRTDARYGAIVTYLPYHSLARSWPRVSNWCVNGIGLNDYECRFEPPGLGFIFTLYDIRL